MLVLIVEMPLSKAQMTSLVMKRACCLEDVCLYCAISKQLAQLYRTYIQPDLLYGSETWALTRALLDKVDAFEF